MQNDFQVTHFHFSNFFLSGPVNNIQVVRRTIVANSNKTQSSWKRRGSILPPPLDKYERSGEDAMDGIVIVDPPPFSDIPVYSSFLSAALIDEQVKELQVCVSSVSLRRKSIFVFLAKMIPTMNFHYCLFVLCYLQQQGSAATEIEMERLKLKYKKSLQMNDQWQKNYENLLQVVMEEEQNGGSN